MKVDKTIELEDGSLTFQGELTGQELDVVVQYGLNTLMALGAINVKEIAAADDLGEKEKNTLQ